MNRKDTVLTISREYGSGGRLIAKELANRLNIPCYDRELIEEISKKSGISKKFIEEAEQNMTDSIKYAGYDLKVNIPLTHVVFKATADLITKIASEGSCIIVGRCADYILKDNENLVKAFIHASIDNKVKRVQEIYKADIKNAKSIIAKYDKDRALYYAYYTDGKWGKMSNYDICLNSDIGIDICVDMLEAIFKK